MAAQPVSPAACALGERVCALGHALGESQVELANACRSHWTFIGQVQCGRRNISLDDGFRLARRRFDRLVPHTEGLAIRGSLAESGHEFHHPWLTVPTVARLRASKR